MGGAKGMLAPPSQIIGGGGGGGLAPPVPTPITYTPYCAVMVPYR